MDHLLGRIVRHKARIGVLLAVVAWAAGSAHAQDGTLGQSLSPSGPAFAKQVVGDVQIVGNRAVKLQEIRGEIETRTGQPFDPIQVQRDVRNLILTKKFFDVKVKTRSGPAPGSVVVIYEVFEFPKIEYVYFIGNDDFSTRYLSRQVGIKAGDPMDPVTIESARKKILKAYNDKGYNKVQIELREGRNQKDRGAVFVINEGPQQRVWKVEFVGNTFVSDGRLMQQIESKPSKIKYIEPLAQGFFNRRKIDEDVQRLTAFYRGFGYMLADVSREIDFEDDGRWATVKFVVVEGPRFRIRNVSFDGNNIFGEQQLRPLLELTDGDYFDLDIMKRDVTKLTDAYGSVGFILSDIKPSPRTLENTPEVDLVYDITEGNRYRVGRINVKISGDNPYTRRSVALNRLSIRPGDIVDIRKVRDSERRLRASGLFLADPVRGVRPKIVFRELTGDESLAERGPDGEVYRGQSPDKAVGERESLEVFVYPESRQSPVDAARRLHP